MRPLLRAEVARVSRRLHAAGWCANHDGNVSVRVGRDRFLCTPTAVSKADVDESMLIVVDADGKVVEGTRKPFGELELHLAIYKARPDMNAVLHAHPPTATAFGVAGVSLEVACLPEFVVSLGRGVPTVPLHLPRTAALRDAVSATSRRSNAFLCAGNGAWSMGTDLEQAFLRLELVEHYAKIVQSARALGGVRELSAEQMTALLESRAKAGLAPPDTGPLPSSKPAEAPAAGPLAPTAGGRPPWPAGQGVDGVSIEELAARVSQRLDGLVPNEGVLRALLDEERRRTG